MLDIVICEDEQDLINLYKIVLSNFVDDHKNDAQIALTTRNPNDVRHFAEEKDNNDTVYILDIEFSDSKIKGIELAKKLRELDNQCKIIFVTSHAELQTIALESEIGEFDYIEKTKDYSYLKQRLIRDLNLFINPLFHSDEAQGPIFKFTIKERTHKILVSHILTITKSSQYSSVTLNAPEIVAKFPGDFEKIRKQLSNFYLLNGDTLINPDHITSFNNEKKQITLDELLTVNANPNDFSLIKKNVELSSK